MDQQPNGVSGVMDWHLEIVVFIASLFCCSLFLFHHQVLNMIPLGRKFLMILRRARARRRHAAGAIRILIYLFLFKSSAEN